MQTATTKVTLTELGGPECTLGVGGTLEDVVKSEMTELGQHVLACTVSYAPPNHPSESLSFRKFYKFAVGDVITPRFGRSSFHRSQILCPLRLRCTRFALPPLSSPHWRERSCLCKSMCRTLPQNLYGLSGSHSIASMVGRRKQLIAPYPVFFQVLVLSCYHKIYASMSTF